MGIAVFIAGVMFLFFLLRAWERRRERADYLAAFHFPLTVSRKVKATYPHLTDAQVARVLEGLREYFAICAMANGRLVSMPSQVVDVAWHEFILFTRSYADFCQATLGRFLHHVPAEAMQAPRQAQDGIKRAWRLSCARAGIDPRAPAALPLLFAIDQELAIPDGFKYSLDCSKLAPAGGGCGGGCGGYCATDIGCGGGCGADSGGDGDGDGGGGGDGGGCGGGGD
jgi:hypothetical protein